MTNDGTQLRPKEDKWFSQGPPVKRTLLFFHTQNSVLLHLVMTPELCFEEFVLPR